MDKNTIIIFLVKFLSFLCYVAKCIWLLFLVIIFSVLVRACNDSAEDKSKEIFGKTEITIDK